MNPPLITRYELTTWILFATGLLLLLHLNLLPALIAGLLVYSLVNMLVPTLKVAALGREGPRLLAVTLIAGVVIALITFAALSLTSWLRNSGENLPALIQRMAEIIENSRDRLPDWLLVYVPEDTEQLRLALV
ncbi:MAG: hypothetical protein IT496_11670, partial [Gammaproteobacteria bacterium]|nr:hypothetical protein [Gammaproteobacteria bacterium]